jgi:hypothetical protein
MRNGRLDRIKNPRCVSRLFSSQLGELGYSPRGPSLANPTGRASVRSVVVSLLNVQSCSERSRRVKSSPETVQRSEPMHQCVPLGTTSRADFDRRHRRSQISDFYYSRPISAISAMTFGVIVTPLRRKASLLLPPIFLMR